MFSIIIPTLNNINYLKVCLDSLNKNSSLNNEILVHVSIGNDGTTEYLKQKKINYTFTDYNAGICEGVNTAAKKSKMDYILYAHDDFYFCPNWDVILKNEIYSIGHDRFYLSGTMINNGQISFDCGQTYLDFNEEKFLTNYKKYNFYDFQGSTWAPHVIHKKLWNDVGGFSLEFWPGAASDPDLNMKLWKKGVRIFKGINDFKVYHFGSVVTRKSEKNDKNKIWSGTKGSKIFLLKWGISYKFFKKYFLKSNTKYIGELPIKPNYTLSFLIDFVICKLYYFYLKYIYSFFDKKA